MVDVHFVGRGKGGVAEGDRPHCGSRQVRGLKHFLTENGRSDDSRAFDMLTLQQPRSSITGYQIIGVAGYCHGQQKSIVGIIGFSFNRQIFQYQSALQVIDHRTHFGRLKDRPQFGIAAGPADFIKLRA